MFTGIVEQIGEVVDFKNDGGNIHFFFQSNITTELKIDQSLAHNGVCLTVVDIDTASDIYMVTVVKETLRKSNLGFLQKGSKINLERSIQLGSRIDGHIVQGHIDQTAVCTEVKEDNGSHIFTFEHEGSQNITVEKGSICVNGVSLTVFNSLENSFSVAIIPYTFEHTNFHTIKVGTVVNLEFDILGKYIAKMGRKNYKR